MSLGITKNLIWPEYFTHPEPQAKCFVGHVKPELTLKTLKIAVGDILKKQAKNKFVWLFFGFLILKLPFFIARFRIKISVKGNRTWKSFGIGQLKKYVKNRTKEGGPFECLEGRATRMVPSLVLCKTGLVSQKTFLNEALFEPIYTNFERNAHQKFCNFCLNFYKCWIFPLSQVYQQIKLFGRNRKRNQSTFKKISKFFDFLLRNLLRKS